MKKNFNMIVRLLLKLLVSIAAFPAHFYIWVFYARSHGVKLSDIFFLKGRAGLYSSRSFVRMSRGQLSKKELIVICRFAAQANNHSVFQKACEKFAGKQMFEYSFTPVQFAGEGHGEGALCTYRVVRDVDDALLFEKIMFSGTKCEKRAIIFENLLQKHLVLTGIGFPAVKRKKVGKNLSVFYYEFLDGLYGAHTLSTDRKKDLLVFFLKKLLEVGGSHRDTFRDGLGDFIGVYEDQVVREGVDYYKKSTSSFLKGYMFVIGFLEHVASCDKSLVFSHGDMSVNNFNNEGFLWDWDRAGFYPAGFDLVWGVVTSFNDDMTIHEMHEISLSIANQVYAKNFQEKILEKNILAFLIICYFRKNKIEGAVPPDVNEFLNCRKDEILNYYSEAA